jgi:hypothetical protein
MKEEKEYYQKEFIEIISSIITKNDDSLEELKRIFVNFYDQSILIWDNIKTTKPKNLQKIILSIQYSLDNKDENVEIESKKIDNLRENLKVN